MSTPTPADAAEVLNWYRGPVGWDQDPAKLWHAGCPDPYATGHDGEVWLDHEGGAFCTGCRHFEPGQSEVANEQPPAPELAAAEQLVNATGAPPLLAPEPEESVPAAEEPSGSINAPADEAPADTPDAAVEGAAAAGGEQASAPTTPPEPAPVQLAAEEPTHIGFFGRIVDDITGRGQG